MVIWAIFIFDFLIKLILAPKKRPFLAKNIITMLSLIIPVFRVFRIFVGLRFLRTLGFIRSVRVVRIVGSFNRAMRILSNTLERRAFGYVILLTLVVCFVGSAAMYAFEKESQGFKTYGEALWWTAMLLTSVASEFWPKTPEGRAICFILSLYSLGVLGYLTAVLASFFIDQDVIAKNNQPADRHEELLQEIRLLNSRLEAHKNQSPDNE